jgi:hypothetical protein
MNLHFNMNKIKIIFNGFIIKVKAFDANKDGYIDFAEFFAFCKKYADDN